MGPQHPMQPLVLDDQKIIRFKRNKIVRFLLDWATERGMSLNELATMPFDDEDRMQLAQLIGYSVGGYGDLSYVSDVSLMKAENAADKLRAKITGGTN